MDSNSNIIAIDDYHISLIGRLTGLSFSLSFSWSSAEDHSTIFTDLGNISPEGYWEGVSFSTISKENFDLEIRTIQSIAWMDEGYGSEGIFFTHAALLTLQNTPAVPEPNTNLLLACGVVVITLNLRRQLC